MPVPDAQYAVVTSYYDAMRAGPEGIDRLLALFTDDAVYTEPFSGQPRTHRGRTAIEANLRTAQTDRPPDLTITVHRIELDDTGLFATWTCESPVFPAPIAGVDRYRLRGDRIAEMVTRFDPPG